jgi:hypothetical protein
VLRAAAEQGSDDHPAVVVTAHGDPFLTEKFSRQCCFNIDSKGQTTKDFD